MSFLLSSDFFSPMATTATPPREMHLVDRTDAGRRANDLNEYDKYLSMRHPGKFEVVKVSHFDFPYDPVFTSRNETLLRLLSHTEYLLDNPCFRRVDIGKGNFEYLLFVNDDDTPLVSMTLGYDLVRDPIVEFARALKDTSSASFAARYVVHGITAVDADILVSSLCMGAKLAWGHGVPYVLSGMAITRECVEKAVAHLNLNGTFMYPEKLRINNHINAYNPFRREIRVTRGLGGGLVKHFDTAFELHNGYFVPGNSYDPDMIAPLDNFLAPEDIMALVLGDKPHYSPYLCTFSSEKDEEASFNCVASRYRLPPTIIRRRCVEPACNSSLAIVKNDFHYIEDMWVSSHLKKAIWQIVDAHVTERQWCAMMAAVPGLADSVNVVLSGRFYYDPLASKAVACSSYFEAMKLRGGPDTKCADMSCIIVVSERIRDVEVDVTERDTTV